MLRKISPLQLRRWIWFDEVEPFDREIWQLAHIAQLLANVNRDPKKYPEAFKLADFVLKFNSKTERVEERATVKEQPAVAMTPEEKTEAGRKRAEFLINAWIGAHNARVEAEAAKGVKP